MATFLPLMVVMETSSKSLPVEHRSLRKQSTRVEQARAPYLVLPSLSTKKVCTSSTTVTTRSTFCIEALQPWRSGTPSSWGAGIFMTTVSYDLLLLRLEHRPIRVAHHLPQVVELSRSL